MGITLTKNGQFADDGVFLAGDVVDKSIASDDGMPGRGKYRINNNRLELRNMNGRVKRTTFTLEPGTLTSAVRRFHLNTWEFIRVR